ncbi:hypothetical protein I317_01627 [Kwoniella heveanensis CBS 569]|nr:hypothetical protein I317_01627 [Kwoniella heveanensis CBS 569]
MPFRPIPIPMTTHQHQSTSSASAPGAFPVTLHNTRFDAGLEPPPQPLSTGSIFRGLCFYVYQGQHEGAGGDDRVEILIKSIHSHGGNLSRSPSPDHVNIIIIPKIPTYLYQRTVQSSSSTSTLGETLGRFAALSNDFAWGDPDAYDAKGKWTPELLIRYFEETVREGRAMKRRKVVVTREWVGACFRAGRVLRDGDDWGGFRIRGTYDIPPLANQPNGSTNCTPDPLGEQEPHVSQEVPPPSVPSHGWWRPNMSVHSHAQALSVPPSKVNNPPTSFGWSSTHSSAQQSHSQPIAIGHRCQQFNPVNTPVQPYLIEYTPTTPQNSHTNNGPITPLTPITPVNLSHHRTLVLSQNVPRPPGSMSHHWQPPDKALHQLQANGRFSQLDQTSSATFTPITPVTASIPSTQQANPINQRLINTLVTSSNHPSSRPAVPLVPAFANQAIPVRPIFVDGQGKPMSFHLPASNSYTLRRYIESGGGQVTTCAKAQYVVLPSHSIDLAKGMLASGANMSELFKWGIEKVLISEQWIDDCLRCCQLVDPSPYMLASSIPEVSNIDSQQQPCFPLVHPTLSNLAEDSAMVPPTWSHMERQGTVVNTSAITWPHFALHGPPRPPVADKPGVTGGSHSVASANATITGGADDEANLTLLLQKFKVKPSSQSPFEFLAEMNLNYPHVKWSMLFLSKRFGNMTKDSALGKSDTLSSYQAKLLLSPPRHAETTAAAEQETSDPPTPQAHGVAGQENREEGKKKSDMTADEMIGDLLERKKSKKHARIRSDLSDPRVEAEGDRIINTDADPSVRSSSNGPTENFAITATDSSADITHDYASASVTASDLRSSDLRSEEDRSNNQSMSEPPVAVSLQGLTGDLSRTSSDFPRHPPDSYLAAVAGKSNGSTTAHLEVTAHTRKSSPLSIAAGADGHAAPNPSMDVTDFTRVPPLTWANEAPQSLQDSTQHIAATDITPNSSLTWIAGDANDFEGSTVHIEPPEVVVHSVQADSKLHIELPGDITQHAPQNSFHTWLNIDGTRHRQVFLGEELSPTISGSSVPDSPLTPLPSAYDLTPPPCTDDDPLRQGRADMPTDIDVGSGGTVQVKGADDPSAIDERSKVGLRIGQENNPVEDSASAVDGDNLSSSTSISRDQGVKGKDTPMEVEQSDGDETEEDIPRCLLPRKRRRHVWDADVAIRRMEKTARRPSSAMTRREGVEDQDWNSETVPTSRDLCARQNEDVIASAASAISDGGRAT